MFRYLRLFNRSKLPALPRPPRLPALSMQQLTENISALTAELRSLAQEAAPKSALLQQYHTQTMRDPWTAYKIKNLTQELDQLQEKMDKVRVQFQAAKKKEFIRYDSRYLENFVQELQNNLNNPTIAHDTRVVCEAELSALHDHLNPSIERVFVVNHPTSASGVIAALHNLGFKNRIKLLSKREYFQTPAARAIPEEDVIFCRYSDLALVAHKTLRDETQDGPVALVVEQHVQFRDDLTTLSKLESAGVTLIGPGHAQMTPFWDDRSAMKTFKAMGLDPKYESRTLYPSHQYELQFLNGEYIGARRNSFILHDLPQLIEGVKDAGMHAEFQPFIAPISTKLTTLQHKGLATLTLDAIDKGKDLLARNMRLHPVLGQPVTEKITGLNLLEWQFRTYLRRSYLPKQKNFPFGFKGTEIHAPVVLQFNILPYASFDLTQWNQPTSEIVKGRLTGAVIPKPSSLGEVVLLTQKGMMIDNPFPSIQPIGYVMTTGSTREAALKKMVELMKKIEFYVDGERQDFNLPLGIALFENGSECSLKQAIETLKAANATSPQPRPGR